MASRHSYWAVQLQGFWGRLLRLWDFKLDCAFIAARETKVKYRRDSCMCVMWDRHVCFIIMVIRKHLGFMMRPCGCDEGIRNPVCLQIPTTSRAAEKLSSALFVKQGPNYGTASSLYLCRGRRRYTKCFSALLPVQHLCTSCSIVYTHMHRQRPGGVNGRAHSVYLPWEFRLLTIGYSDLALIFF